MLRLGDKSTINIERPSYKPGDPLKASCKVQQIDCIGNPKEVPSHDKIKIVMEKLWIFSGCVDHPDIQYLSRLGNTVLFKYSQYSDLTFLIAQPNVLVPNVPSPNNSKGNKQLFSNICQVAKICHENSLNALYLPTSSLWTIKIKIKTEKENIKSIYHLIVQTCPQLEECSEKDRYNGYLYKKYSDTLTLAMEQMALLIAKTTMRFFDWSNFPLLVEPNEQGCKRICLWNLVLFCQTKEGILGNMNPAIDSRGLIRCAFSEEQIDKIIKAAQNNGFPEISENAQKVKAERMKELNKKKQIALQPPKPSLISRIFGYCTII